MDIRPLTDNYAVSPQIAPEDAAAIRAAGYTTVICNRPDMEIPPDLHAGTMRAAMEAEGLSFVVNPLVHGAFTMDHVEAQAEAIAQAPGPVLAYCASGNRSSIAWAFAMAGKIPTDELIRAAGQYGYPLEQFRSQLESLAQS